jgi:hypothetical protein
MGSIRKRKRRGSDIFYIVYIKGKLLVGSLQVAREILQ